MIGKSVMTQFVFNLFILSPARFCFSRGSRVTCGSFGFLSNRVYTTVNLTPLNKDNQIKQSISNRPENLALDHINSGNTTTATVINNILSNQKVAITEKKLKELLSIKGI